MNGEYRTWEDARPEASWFDPFFLTIAPPALSRFSKSSPLRPKLLHLGCGLGVKSETLRRLGYDVVGIDLDEESLHRAKRSFPHVSFVAGDMDALPFDDASFDAVFSFSTLQLSSNKQRAIDETARVLRSRGRALFIENLKGSPLARGYRAMHAFLGFRYGKYEVPKDHFELGDLLRFEPSFEEIETSVHHLTTPLTLVVPALLTNLRNRPMRVQGEALYRLLARFDGYVLHALPATRRFGWHIAATMTRRSR